MGSMRNSRWKGASLASTPHSGLGDSSSSPPQCAALGFQILQRKKKATENKTLLKDIGNRKITLSLSLSKGPRPIYLSFGILLLPIGSEIFMMIQNIGVFFWFLGQKLIGFGVKQLFLLYQK